ncbi:MAG: alkaline phosphatase family protein [Armatimonadota bacterium]|nr:alkaline phosphatase family protein [Armatimonadota bacterium]
MKRLVISLLLPFVFLIGSTSIVFAEPAKYLALIVIDAMRPDYMELAPTPILHKMREEGTYYDGSWVGYVINNTAPSHASISTGCYPKKHGIVGFRWKDPATGKVYDPTEYHKVIKGELSRIASANNVPSIAQAVKAGGPAAIAVVSGGHKPYAAGPLALNSANYTVLLGGGGRNIDLGLPGPPNEKSETTFIQGQRPPDETLIKIRALKTRSDEWSIDAATIMLKNHKPRVLLINLPQVDGTGHSCGGIISPGAMRPTVERADRVIGRLIEDYKKLGIYDNTVFVVVGDHGMIPDVSPVSSKVMKDAIKKAGTEFLSSAGTGPIWIVDSSKAKDVAEAVMATKPEACSGGYYKIKLAEGKYEYRPAPTTEKTIDPKLDKTYRYLLSTAACANGPDLFFCSAEMSKIPKNFPKKGKHYQISWGTQHIPIIMAGPGVKKGFVSKSPARLVDLAPTVLALVGIEPKGMDGIVLADALLSSTKEQQDAQNEINKFLAPLRNALQEQPKYDPTEKDPREYSSGGTED